MDNYYKILGVKNFASLDEIKIAYKKLAMKFHPDVNDGDKFFEEKFKELQLAYETLSDSNTRDSYDENLKRSFQNINLNLKPTQKEEAKNTSSSQKMRRQSPYIYHKGRWLKRRRF
jgi:DnaJ-class molecular chaperone